MTDGQMVALYTGCAAGAEVALISLYSGAKRAFKARKRPRGPFDWAADPQLRRWLTEPRHYKILPPPYRHSNGGHHILSTGDHHPCCPACRP